MQNKYRVALKTSQNLRNYEDESI